TDPPPPTEVPPTQPALPSPTPLPPPTEAVAPPDPPAGEAPAYYKEEFDETGASFYPAEYYYRILNGPDQVDEDLSLDNGKLIFNIDTKDTWIYLNYFPWIIEMCELV
ncbi:MAG: hypothetical protein HC806_08260, partial [Anaerolineae bacterium]|nr:hypothetical protein [Anaerolineae bacterium]